MAEGYLSLYATDSQGRSRMTSGGVSHMAVDGEEEVFSTPARNGEDAAVTAEVMVVSDERGSSSAATAPVWEIGQRVKQDGRGEGIVLFVGKLHTVDGKLLPGNYLWYGVSLDEKKGINGGCVDGIKYFHCQEKYGIFVQATKLQVAEMSPNDSVLKTLLSGGTVLQHRLSKMTRVLLRVFLEHKDVKMEPSDLKDELISVTVKAMGAEPMSSTPVRLAESMHATSVGNLALENGYTSNNDVSLIPDNGADVAAGNGAVPAVLPRSQERQRDSRCGF